MLDAQIQWMTAQPLWNALTQTPQQIQRPAVLRYASDAFMQDLASQLQTNPSVLASNLAQPESFRARPAGEPLDWTSVPTQLKLYQPVHGHFYLVAASLVCRVTGLPDRAVNTAQNEKVSFVLRRVTNDGEQAWVTTPTKGWQPIAAAQTNAVAAGEELLPMFPVNFMDKDYKRRLFVGLIPTSSRESFQAAPTLSPLLLPADDPDLAKEQDARVQEVDSRVITPLKLLVTPASTVFGGASSDPKVQARQQERELETSRFILLDLMDFFNIYLPNLWQQIKNGPPPPANDAGFAVYNDLANADADSGTKWRAALQQAWEQRKKITGEEAGEPTLNLNLKNSKLDPDQFLNDLKNALAAAPFPTTPTPNMSVPPVPKIAPGDGSLYILRCVYQRLNCGPLERDIVSNPTTEFAIAPFFDFDAPSRPIRISMPVDTSIAGLRKFQKNVSFLISDKLRQQMECATDLKKAMDGNLSCGDQFDLGMICSFSIPIITICALLVLMIFLFLLNIIFWWLPFFRICIPILLKFKPSSSA